MKTGKGLRWKIVWILFLSTALNYVNRQTFSLLAPVISKQLHFSHEDLSRVFGAFQITYAWTWLLGGVFLDLVGARLGLTLAVIWWSIASILSGAANSLHSFIFCRALLGVGEGMNWPGASKVVAEWFPAKERSVAVAIFDSGSSVGAAIAAVAVPLVALKFGWRSAFVLSGLLGAGWLYFFNRKSVKQQFASSGSGALSVKVIAGFFCCQPPAYWFWRSFRYPPISWAL